MNFFDRFRRKPALPQVSPEELAAQARWRAEREEQARRKQAIVDADTAEAGELAEQVAGASRLDLTVGEVLPVCEVVIAYHRLARDGGYDCPEPDVADMAETCEDLVTRNRRRGYGALVPSLVLLGTFGYSYDGGAIGYENRWKDFLRDWSRALPDDNSRRLSAMQNPPAKLAEQRLAELKAADVEYVS